MKSYDIDLRKLNKFKHLQCPCIVRVSKEEKDKYICPCDDFTLHGKCRCGIFIDLEKC